MQQQLVSMLKNTIFSVQMNIWIFTFLTTLCVYPLEKACTSIYRGLKAINHTPFSEICFLGFRAHGWYGNHDRQVKARGPFVSTISTIKLNDEDLWNSDKTNWKQGLEKNQSENQIHLNFNRRQWQSHLKMR